MKIKFAIWHGHYISFHYICIIIVVSYFLYSKYVHYYVIDRNIQNVIFILHKSNYYFECYWTWNNVCITSTISGKEQERIVPGESYSPSNLLLTAKYWVDCVQRMIKIADTDGSGVVEFQEFMEMICDQMEVRSSSKHFRRWEGAYIEPSTCVFLLSNTFLTSNKRIL